LKSAHEAKDVAACDAASAELQQVLQSAAQDIYGAQQQADAQPNPGQQSGNAGNAGNSGEPQDVDFEEVK
jgi:molecular chaperone DnaK